MQEAHKRRVFALRVHFETPDIMDSIAKKLGYLRVDGDGTIKGSTGVLLDKIANGELIIVSYK